MATSYDVDYNDARFKQVESDKNTALTQSNSTYDNMINESDKYYQAQIDASKAWADKQTEIQQANTDFAIEKINQEKEQAEKDYKKEQSGAYVDWQKESNRYGANAETKAASGLTNTGYSESSQVSLYNTYQNRVATARDTYNKAVLNYDNAIKDAQLQNNSTLAEIAYEALQNQLELSLSGFQYKNNLVLQKQSASQTIEDTYYNRYQDVLSQINTENSLKESARQFDANMAYQKEQADRDYQLQLAALNSSSSSGGSGGGSSYSSSYDVSGYTDTASSDSGKTYAVNTDYYQGDLNADANKYGTFSNGYQPKGISGYGAVSKTGDTITLDTQTLSGQKKTVTQNIWKTSDGSKWYWDGRKNRYIKLTSSSSAGVVGKTVAKILKNTTRK